MAKYQLSILTPQGELFNEPVEALTAQGVLGSFGVLAGHAPIIYSLDKGTLKITSEGRVKFFTHQSGILEVKPDHNVLVLVDEAVEGESKLTDLKAAKSHVAH
jgi:F-type H+-transporting ATPase subunit epsilon